MMDKTRFACVLFFIALQEKCHIARFCLSMPTGTPWLFLTEEEDSVEIEEVFDERASVVKLLPKLDLVLEKRILFCILFFVLFLFEVRVALSTEEVGCVISMSLAIFVVVLLDEKREGEVETSKNERSPSSSCNCCNQTSASCCIGLEINC
jgi:hypothetical protein